MLSKPWVKEVPLQLKKHGVLIGLTRKAFFPDLHCVCHRERERARESERERARERERERKREREKRERETEREREKRERDAAVEQAASIGSSAVEKNRLRHDVTF